MNGEDWGEGNLKSFYGYKETFEKETTWVDVPPQLTFLHTNNPYEDDLEEEVYDTLSYTTQGLTALSEAVAAQNHIRSQHDYVSPSTASPQQDQPSAAQNLDFILNPSETSKRPMADLGLQQSPSTRDHFDISAIIDGDAQPTLNHARTPSYASPRTRTPSSRIVLDPRILCGQRSTITDPELAFLLRDYAERSGLWMDLFDLGLFFSTTVPTQAVSCPLLLYSCVALSAKSLGRVSGRKPTMGGQIVQARQSSMETWPGMPMAKADWYQKAREYYDLAVSLLRQALSGLDRPSTSSLPTGATPGSISNAQGFPLPTTDSDELVAATAILCVYEFLDASGSEWSRHLDGAKTLFDIAQDRMVTLASLPPSPVLIPDDATRQFSSLAGEPARRGLSTNRRSVFWNFARQDMLSAFINNSSTRLDPNDLAMWRSAGLKFTSDGFICPSNRRHPDFSPVNAMTEDTISNALIWLLSKLVNFIAAGDDLSPIVTPLGLGVRQRELLDYWEGLDKQLTAWYDGLPDCFHAPAVCTISVGGLDIEEKWFPRPMCASTMQSYHFARIQLLHNKPHVTTGLPAPATPHISTGLAARHASYTSILHQSREHAKEIVAIGLGRSDEGTRVHSVQPLWTAGLVLGNGDMDGQMRAETVSWRRVIISQLRGIQQDMGWASEYRVQTLLELWDLLPDWGPDSDVDGG